MDEDLLDLPQFPIMSVKILALPDIVREGK